ncbi:unnamed protein product [Natator depressus]
MTQVELHCGRMMVMGGTAGPWSEFRLPLSTAATRKLDIQQARRWTLQGCNSSSCWKKTDRCIIGFTVTTERCTTQGDSLLPCLAVHSKGLRLRLFQGIPGGLQDAGCVQLVVKVAGLPGSVSSLSRSTIADSCCMPLLESPCNLFADVHVSVTGL